MIQALFEKDNSVVIVIENPNEEETLLIRRLHELEKHQKAENPDACKAALLAGFRSVKASQIIDNADGTDNDVPFGAEDEFEEFVEI